MVIVQPGLQRRADLVDGIVGGLAVAKKASRHGAKETRAGAEETQGALVERKTFLERIDDVAPLDFAALRGWQSSPAVMLHGCLHRAVDIMVDAVSDGAVECGSLTWPDGLAAVRCPVDGNDDVCEVVRDLVQDNVSTNTASL